MADVTIPLARSTDGAFVRQRALEGSDTGAAATSGTANTQAGRCILDAGNAAFTLSNSKLKAGMIVGYAVESSTDGKFIKQVAVTDGQAVFTLDGASAGDLTFAWWIVGY